MDESVLAAMARWPNVPAVFGWLGLDRRGNWRLRGEPVDHPGLRDFLGRNYASDESGRFFVQNGPQRVFVALAYTPWVLRLEDEALIRHDRRPFAEPRQALVDDLGSLLLLGDAGVALVDDRDLPAMLDRLCDDHGRRLPDARVEAALTGDTRACRILVDGRSLPLEAITHEAVAVRFGFEPDPRPPGDGGH
ncbi:MAG: DUF2946 family protein [Rhodocyclaceae bacterium]|nr:DUF2946 family protein [Rhodocyclaceae bacterium]